MEAMSCPGLNVGPNNGLLNLAMYSNKEYVISDWVFSVMFSLRRHP